MTAGLCQPRNLGTVGAEPFSAKLRYTGADDPDHTNLIKLTVTMPHIDGELVQPFLLMPPSTSNTLLVPSMHTNRLAPWF